MGGKSLATLTLIYEDQGRRSILASMKQSSREKAVWDQTSTPVVLRRAEKKQKIRLRLPYSADNRQWLKNNRRIHPIWVESGKYWELPKTWFDDFVNRALIRYGQVYIFQPHRELEKCAPACQGATGHDCNCSCMGANHGAGSDGSWFEVSETFSFRWHSQPLACRLLTRK